MCTLCAKRVRKLFKEDIIKLLVNVPNSLYALITYTSKFKVKCVIKQNMVRRYCTLCLVIIN